MLKRIISCALALTMLSMTLISFISCEKKVTYKSIEEAVVGDIVIFGKYEQDGDESDDGEDIEWIVLDVDDEEGRVLLITKYVIECKKFNEKYSNVTKNIVWSNSGIRTWLNGTFLNSAFTAEERTRIHVTTNTDNGNSDQMIVSGVKTTDRVFLLSINEAREYFADDEARKAVATTEAKKNGAYENAETKTSRWWLRSPGKTKDTACFVDKNGCIDTVGDGIYGTGDYPGSDWGNARPCIWVNYLEEE